MTKWPKALFSLLFAVGVVGCEIVLAVDHDRVDGGGCPAGLTLCKDGQCWNLETNPMSCGECGRACSFNEICSSGSCECSQGTLRCNLVCTSVFDDPTNCGGCGVVCGPNETCANGVCAPCPFGTKSCAFQSCTDVTADPTNCGQCGKLCGPGEVCATGICSRCQAGWTLCGNLCSNLATDRSNCGQCGHGCPFVSCFGGHCEFEDAGTDGPLDAPGDVDADAPNDASPVDSAVDGLE